MSDRAKAPHLMGHTKNDVTTGKPAKTESGGIFVVDNNEEVRIEEDEEETIYKFNYSHNKAEHLKKMLSFTDLRQVWNSYSQKEVYGKKVFDRNLFNDVKTAVLASPQVMRTIHEQGKKSSVRATTSKADQIADQMMAQMKESVVRPMAYLATKIIHQLYSSIHVTESDIQRLQMTAKKAHDEGVSMVFLPTHKSHIDYVVLELLWFHCNISLPFIAAGENLDIPLVGGLFNNCGAFYISRPFPNDPLYKAIFNEYIAQLLIRGYNLEFFPEGGRSRSGKLLPPKLGMIASILSVMHDKRIKDCYLVPISISYEKVIETGTYIQELLGKAKQPESVNGLLRAAEVLRFNFGQIDIKVGEAASCLDLIQKLTSRGLDVTKLQFRPGDEKIVAKNRYNVSRYVAFDMLHRINDISVATPSAMVVTCLLTNIGRGVGRKEMIENVRWLRNEILLRGGHVSVFGLDNVERMVDRVTLLLRSCIDRRLQMEVIYSPSKRFELSFYRNQLIHLFVGESTLACALYGGLNDFTPGIFVPRQAVEAETMFLSSLFKYEFIYKPKSAGEFSKNFQSTLAQMVKRGVLEFDQDSDEICIARSGPKVYSFLGMFLWPFIESYWVALISLWSLYPQELVEIKEYLTGAQQFAETLYYRGELTFFEAISIGNLQAALTRFEEMGIIEKQLINDKGTSVIKLSKEYQNKNNFRAAVEHLGKFRRFGKYKKEPNFSKQVRELAKGIVKKRSRL
eukprot:TRINITY_DN782_c0_g1_i1.p1 TRINITY_DN782_c0_g1~~TRINITY_DN782_c0_g1_i1.p1  ORF type:complete len:738 (-),score=124.21 TRINITY_DN782_c0_g1_i1:160-2373(-)